MLSLAIAFHPRVHSCPGSSPEQQHVFTPTPPLASIPAVYSLVKYAGVRNYIVATWEASDLAACADLNLPCADVAAYLPAPMDHAENAGAYGTHDYFVSGAGFWAECINRHAPAKAHVPAAPAGHRQAPAELCS